VIIEKEKEVEEGELDENGEPKSETVPVQQPTV
jgi:hypothetical protein